ncbi:MAG: aldose 1-epimerase family protein [Microvirga sp.]
MPHSSETVALAADGASATIALCGAEPLSWRVAGRELIWHGDPAHWPQRAPILFPVVGASAGGAVRVEGRSYPMPRHGFARDLPFGLVERRPDRARLRLGATNDTLRYYPFRFELEVEAVLAADRLSLRFTVTNADDRPMPYGLGFHPGFPWPFDGGSPERYRLVFERPEDAAVPDITAEGLLRPGLRRAPFAGRVLPLNPEMFEPGALVLQDISSRSVRFQAPGGSAIVVEPDGFRHLALWTKPGAPFLCIEPWTGEPDTDGFSGELCERASIRMLTAGTTAEHVVTMRFAER